MTASSWDQELLGLALDNVRIRAGSLPEGWKAASTRHLLRSVLVVGGEASDSRSFAYESPRCAVQELYDALADRYRLKWTQDGKTGVTWLHPRELDYHGLLSDRVHVVRRQLGLPMQSGTLEVLEADPAARIAVKHWGSSFRNTFDYAIDIPIGTHTVRDVLNLCCAANPTKTFLVRLKPGEVFVTAVNLVSDDADSVPAGAVHWWNSQVVQGAAQSVPAAEEVAAALADREVGARYNARCYLEGISWTAAIDEWAASSVSTAQALWTCIGISSVLVRCEQATHRASIETMQRRATRAFLAKCDPNLALMTALELARLAKEVGALEVVAKRRIRAEDLAEVASDACRVVALSRFVRDVLQTKSAGALLEAMPAVAAAVRSPTPGKLEFQSFH